MDVFTENMLFGLYSITKDNIVLCGKYGGRNFNKGEKLDGVN